MANGSYTLIETFDVLQIRPDPAPNWRWAVQLPDIPAYVPVKYVTSGTGVSSTITGYSSSGGQARVSLPYVVVEKFDVPSANLHVDSRFGCGTSLHYPRFSEVNQFNLTFYEDMYYSVTAYLVAWGGMIRFSNNDYGVPKDYKKDIILGAFDTMHNYAPRVIFTMVACWPINPVGGLMYEHSPSGYISVSCDFSVDDTTTDFVNFT